MPGGNDDLFMRLDALRAVVNDMTTTTKSIKSTLHNLETAAKTTLDEEHWSGPAKYAYTICQGNWSNAAENCSVLLGQASDLLDQIVAMAKQINKGVVDMWLQYAGQ